MIDTAVDALSRDELRVGVAIGAIAFVVVFLLSRITASVARRRMPGKVPASVPVAGIAIAIGGAAAIDDTSSFPTEATIGLLLLAVGGGLARRSWSAGLLLAVPGALFVASSAPDGQEWSSIAVFTAIVVGSAGTASFDRRPATLDLGPLVFGVSVCAVYITVPDTEQALALVGAVAPLSIVGWPLRFARLGNAGSFASVGLLAWVVATGGVARSGAVIGGLACLGVLAIEPAARAFAQLLPPIGADTKGTPFTSQSGAISIVVLHIVVVVLIARTAGRTSSASAALAIVAAVAFSATLFLVAGFRRSWFASR